MKSQPTFRSIGYLLRTLGIALWLLPIGDIFAQPDMQRPFYLSSLKSVADYTVLKGSPVVEKYGQVESVKVLWELKKDKLYFISSYHYKWHYRFARQRLGYWQNRTVFNERNYGERKDREYVLANLNHYLANDLWTVEFSSADQIPLATIHTFMPRLQAAFIPGKVLHLFLNTHRLVEAFSEPTPPVSYPVVRADDIYGGQLYQPLNLRGNYGYLRKIKVEDLKKSVPGRHDIVVLDGPALDIPAVAGLMSPDFQTPLSHLNILCKNRGTPFLAHRNIWRDPRVNALAGKLVYFEVLADTFRLREADLGEAQPVWQANVPREPVALPRNLKSRELWPMNRLSARSVNLVGGKAANFAVLHRLARRSGGKWKVPEGAFAIPFVYYVEHLRSSGADTLIQHLLNDPAARNDPQQLAMQLKTIRKRIKKSPVDPDLLVAVAERVRAESPTLRMRFRSSTNAEDIDGFNGAGLYSSKTGIVGDATKPIDQAIRKVWASVWNYRAFQEREYFNLRQEDVAMGILVHRSFPDEHANGVAITKNLYRPGYFGVVINVQRGETSVVSPPPGVTCDQLICYSENDIRFYTSRRIIEYISYSSENAGQPVLTEAQVLRLAEHLGKIKKHYYYNVPGTRSSAGQSFYDFALDVEFKFDGPDSTLYLKQARPYND
ncbi:MAG: PEP/pyruvate-binding domain-containing protein [Bacteroidota bacterium]